MIAFVRFSWSELLVFLDEVGTNQAVLDPLAFRSRTPPGDPLSLPQPLQHNQLGLLRSSSIQEHYCIRKAPDRALYPALRNAAEFGLSPASCETDPLPSYGGRALESPTCLLNVEQALMNLVIFL